MKIHFSPRNLEKKLLQQKNFKIQGGKALPAPLLTLMV